MAEKKEKELTAMEQLEESTGLDRDELVDKATVAVLSQRWVPDGEVLHDPGEQPEEEEVAAPKDGDTQFPYATNTVEEPAAKTVPVDTRATTSKK